MYVTHTSKNKALVDHTFLHLIAYTTIREKKSQCHKKKESHRLKEQKSNYFKHRHRNELKKHCSAQFRLYLNQILQYEPPTPFAL